LEALARILWRRRLPFKIGGLFLKQSCAGVLQPSRHHFANPLEQFMTESEVVVAVLAEHNSGKANGNDRLGRAGIKMPEIWGEQPGPSERFARVNDIGRDWPVF
jgi:hypothetical protein